MRNKMSVVVLLTAVGLMSVATSPATAQEYPCVDQAGLSIFDPNQDDVLTLQELRDISEQFPDNQALQDLVQQGADDGLAGIQYKNCETGGDARSTEPAQQAADGIEGASADVDVRLIALETQVAELERRVDALESRIEALESGTTAPEPVSGNSGVNSQETGVVKVSGSGSTVSEDFQLESGRYKVTLTLEGGCCIAVFLYGPSGGSDLLFNEIFDFESEGGTATDIYQAAEAGSYFVDSQNTTSPWTITFEKR